MTFYLDPKEATFLTSLITLNKISILKNILQYLSFWIHSRLWLFRTMHASLIHVFMFLQCIHREPNSYFYHYHYPETLSLICRQIRIDAHVYCDANLVEDTMTSQNSCNKIVFLSKNTLKINCSFFRQWLNLVKIQNALLDKNKQFESNQLGR